MNGTKVVHTQKAYSMPEELTNIITYAFAAVLSFVGLVFFVLKAVEFGRLAVFSSVVWGASNVFVFTVGALCHIPALSDKVTLKRIDGCSVGILIVGIFTPVLLLGLGSGVRSDELWSYVLVPIMFLTVTAAILINAFDVTERRAISLVLYVIIGWAGAVRISRIPELCGNDCFYVLFGGCAAFALGAVLCAIERLPARHILWHFFVISGAAIGFMCVYGYIL